MNEEFQIPNKEDQINIAEMYWALLRAFDSKTGKEDILDKHLISQGYQLWEKVFGPIL